MTGEDLARLEADASSGDPEAVAKLVEAARFLAVQADAAVSEVKSGDLVVLRMPDHCDVDHFAHSARQLWAYLHGKGIDAHIVVLEHDTRLEDVHPEVMARAGWQRAPEEE